MDTILWMMEKMYFEGKDSCRALSESPKQTLPYPTQGVGNSQRGAMELYGIDTSYGARIVRLVCNKRGSKYVPQK